MSEEIAKRADTTPAAAATADLYEKYGRAASNRRFDRDLFKFGKDGAYTAGQENRVIKAGTRMIAYMPSLKCGFVHWRDGFPVEEVMGLVGEGYVPPKRDTLGDTDKDLWESYDEGEPRDPWQFTNTLVLYDPASKKFYTFSTSAKGGLGAIGELCKEYGQHERQQPGDWPIVSLEGGSYQHRIRSRGRIHYPIFRLDGWVAAKDQPAIEGSEQQQIEDDQSLPGF